MPPEAAADGIPAPATDRQRVVFGRIQSLATKTSEQASASHRSAPLHIRPASGLPRSLLASSPLQKRPKRAAKGVRANKTHEREPDKALLSSASAADHRPRK